jgi:hypothetical protein
MQGREQTVKSFVTIPVTRLTSPSTGSRSPTQPELHVSTIAANKANMDLCRFEETGKQEVTEGLHTAIFLTHYRIASR